MDPIQRAWTRLAAAAALVSASFLASGCGPTLVSTASKIHPALQNKRLSRLQRNFERQSHASRNLNLSATLWDLALVESDGLEDPKRRRSRAISASAKEANRHADARKSRWGQAYLADQTTFTVVVELLNRPAPTSLSGKRRQSTKAAPGPQDPLAEAEAWTFSLSRGGRNPVAPTRVQVQAMDRYPTVAGGWHWRMVYAVHFDGPSSAERQALTLRIHPPKARAWRGEYGKQIDQRGFPLRWQVSPASFSI